MNGVCCPRFFFFADEKAVAIRRRAPFPTWAEQGIQAIRGAFDREIGKPDGQVGFCGYLVCRNLVAPAEPAGDFFQSRVQGLGGLQSRFCLVHGYRSAAVMGRLTSSSGSKNPIGSPSLLVQAFSLRANRFA